MIFFAICPYQPQLNGPIIQNISRTAELGQVDSGVWCITTLQSPEEIATATYEELKVKY